MFLGAGSAYPENAAPLTQPLLPLPIRAHMMDLYPQDNIGLTLECVNLIDNNSAFRYITTGIYSSGTSPLRHNEFLR